MTTTEDKPVDRDAWRRLLDGGTDGPPGLTDARIRAKARQTLTPRARRWWLPASLAASMLLAIVLVQQQHERPRAPAVVSESDYAATAVEPAAKPDDRTRDEALRRQDSPAPEAPAERMLERAAPREKAESKEDLQTVTRAPPVMPPPLMELPAREDSRVLSGEVASAPPTDAAAPPTTPAPAAKREEAIDEIVVTGSRQRQADQESSTPVTQDTSEDASGRSVANSGALMKSGEAGRSPEEWYAEIEKLRAAGRKREARRELKKLEEAHPGWLEKNHPRDR